MAFSVLHKMKDESTAENGKNNVFVDILCDAYDKLVSILYNKTGEAEKKELIDKLLENKCPLNIRTNEYDQKVLSSIKTDTSILDTINRILMLMFTSNQYLVQTPMHNIYSADER
jgi:DNA-binding MltR family transcriptional regulator